MSFKISDLQQVSFRLRDLTNNAQSIKTGVWASVSQPA